MSHYFSGLLTKGCKINWGKVWNEIRLSGLESCPEKLNWIFSG